MITREEEDKDEGDDCSKVSPASKDHNKDHCNDHKENKRNHYNKKGKKIFKRLFLKSIYLHPARNEKFFFEKRAIEMMITQTSTVNPNAIRIEGTEKHEAQAPTTNPSATVNPVTRHTLAGHLFCTKYNAISNTKARRKHMVTTHFPCANSFTAGTV